MNLIFVLGQRLKNMMKWSDVMRLVTIVEVVSNGEEGIGGNEIGGTGEDDGQDKNQLG